MRTCARAVFAIAALLVVAGCNCSSPTHSPSGADSAKKPSDDSEPTLQDLSDDAREFRQAFNAAKGTVRIVLLVSPG